MSELPRVTIVTPTMKSRVRFMDLMLMNVSSQTYPHDKIEWLVVGDNDPETREAFVRAFDRIPRIKCRYVVCDIPRDIGAKRNFACSMAKTKIIANMDDDDVYNKEYVLYSVCQLKETKSGLVGCRDMLIFFPDSDGKMVMIRGSSVHEATMVHTKSHWRTNGYHDGTMKGEGTRMVNGNYSNELDIRKVMICVSHGENTYGKSRFLESPEVQLDPSHRRHLVNITKGYHEK